MVVAGVITSGILWVPTAYGIKNSTRMETVISTDSLWHYDFQTYLKMLFDSFEPSVSTYMILPVFVIWGGIILILKRKKSSAETCALRMMLLSVLLYMIPFWGLLSKGFSNISNYWYFGMIFFFAYGMVYAFNTFMEPENLNSILKPLMGSLLYILAYYLAKGNVVIKSYVIWFLALTILIVFIVKKTKFYYSKELLTVSIFINCLCLFFISTWNIIDNFMDVSTSVMSG